ncbi:MAG: anhydro-N-acetylmuramic acid kinase [Legionellales bacterium]|nr:anhydro-N-acetylmuramic acid kinase [Legionellales bacterium]
MRGVKSKQLCYETQENLPPQCYLQFEPNHLGCRDCFNREIYPVTPVTNYYIGLMSGSSLDGIDATLVEIVSDHQPTVLAATQTAIPQPLRQAVLNTYHQPILLSDAAQWDYQWGELFAQSTHRLLTQCNIPASAIHAIGSHGQTIYHQPSTSHPYSIQWGAPSVIAALTQIPTVAYFRSLDLAYGGQGAPLAPAFHQQMFASTKETRVVINLGGMANITELPHQNTIRCGFDTGPGNVLLDAWHQHHHGDPYDINGEWARQGTPHTSLLNQLLATDYFHQPPPKSTGREQFNLAWLQQQLKILGACIEPADVQATLVELTAQSIAQGIDQLSTSPTTAIVCGGGIHNIYLKQRLQHHLGTITLASSQLYGLDPQWVEATAFAWMAAQALARIPLDLTSITGSHQPHVFGGIFYP